MIIGIDASRANVKQKSGTELVAYNLIQEIKKIADPRDRFILYSKEPLRGPLADLPPNFTNRVLHWPPRYIWTQLRLSWEMLTRAPDILFVPAHTIPIIHPKKTYTVLHDIGFEYYADLYSKQRIGYSVPFGRSVLNLFVRLFTFGKYGANEIDYHRWSALFAIRHATKIITVSEFSRQAILKRYPVNPKKVITLHNAFNFDFYHLPDQSSIIPVLAKYKLHQPYLLFIGRLELKKNIPNLIKAFAFLKKNFHYPGSLVLIGKPGFGFEDAKRTITENELTKFVLLPGWIESEDIPKIMNGAEVFVFPSQYEGFGMPILEAMNCGIPVITSNRGALAEIAGQAAALVNPDDISDIATTIHQVVTRPAFKSDLIQKGYARSAQFSWAKAALEYMDILTQRK